MKETAPRLHWLSIKGAVQMILRLMEEDLYTSQLYRSEMNPEGIGSSQTVNKLIGLFERIQLIERYGDETRPRLYLRLTDKGRAVAEHLKAIEEIIQSP